MEASRKWLAVPVVALVVSFGSVGLEAATLITMEFVLGELTGALDGLVGELL
jgi:hypothetical protein